jgi:hypothetical protein
MSSIIKVDTIQNQSGANIIGESSNTITVGGSGDTLALASGVLQSNLMYPAFHATSNVGQSIAQDTTTKVQYNTEVFDTDSCYDTSNYRFTPNKAGKYFIYATFRYETSDDFQSNQMWIYKNGAEFIQVLRPQQHYTTLDGQAIVECNGSSDYIEIYARQESGSGSYTMSNNSKRIYFYGYRIGT